MSIKACQLQSRRAVPKPETPEPPQPRLRLETLESAALPNSLCFGIVFVDEIAGQAQNIQWNFKRQCKFPLGLAFDTKHCQPHQKHDLAEIHVDKTPT